MIIETRKAQILDATVPMTCPDCKQEHWMLRDFAISMAEPICGDCLIERWKVAFSCAAPSADS